MNFENYYDLCFNIITFNGSPVRLKGEKLNQKILNLPFSEITGKGFFVSKKCKMD